VSERVSDENKFQQLIMYIKTQKREKKMGWRVQVKENVYKSFSVLALVLLIWTGKIWMYHHHNLKGVVTKFLYLLFGSTQGCRSKS